MIAHIPMTQHPDLPVLVPAWDVVNVTVAIIGTPVDGQLCEVEVTGADLQPAIDACIANGWTYEL